MRTHPILSVLIALSLLGCSGGGDDASEDGTTTTSTTAADDANGAPQGSTPTSTAPGGGTDGTSGATNGADPAAGAALDRYLDALGANDFTAAFAVSRDGMQALAVVRSIVHASNSQAGGTTTSRFDERRLTPSSVSRNEARFTGNVALTSTVSGAGAEAVTTTDRFDDLVVRRDGSEWKVAEATYNGRSVVHHAGTAIAQAGPVQVHLTGALAFGNSLAVVARLVATGEHEVEVRFDQLRVGDEAAASMTRVVVGGQPGSVYVAYPRRDERPTEWDLTLRVDGSDHQLTFTF